MKIKATDHLNLHSSVTEPKKTELTFRLLRYILSQASKGKSLGRIHSNYLYSSLELSGEILDLGAGSDSGTYHSALQYKKPFKVTYSDLYRKGENLVEIDLEKPFKLPESSFDCIICNSVLEHIYDYKNIIRESYRVLRDGGIFVGSVPFIYRFHPDPNDYFRFTHQALFKIFTEEGFICRRMVFVGFGPFSSSQSISILPRFIRPPIILLSVLLDSILSKRPMQHQLGYFFIFEKPKIPY